MAAPNLAVAAPTARNAPSTSPMATQPVITITAITSLASAILGGLALVVDLPPNTEKVVLGIITSAYPIVTAAWTWHKVYAPATVQRIADQQYVAGTPPTQPQPQIPPPGDVSGIDPMDEDQWPSPPPPKLPRR